MSQMNVQIVTPDGLVYDHHAAFVSVKTIDGELGILPHHINTIAVLTAIQSICLSSSTRRTFTWSTAKTAMVLI